MYAHQIEIAAVTMIDVAAKVTDDQLDRPTPCGDMRLSGLLGHAIGLSLAFAAAGRKEFGPLTATTPSPGNETLPDPWWPALTGNLRELEQVLDVAIALCEGRVIDQPDLPAPVDTATPATDTEDSLEQVMEACSWNMSCAARRLGVNRSTILRRLRKAGLQPPG